MSDSFKDHFSGNSSAYAAHRPRYPRALHEWLSGLLEERALAWDAATGSGQAATDIAAYVEQVVASDASATQIASAVPNGRVEYRVAPSERVGLANDCVDLVTCAQSLHWFDIPAFLAEAQRVLRPGGVFAAWCYGLFSSDDEVGPALREFAALVEPCWPPERRMVEEGYRSIELPFEEIAAPPFEMNVQWSGDQAVAYLHTWSATQRYVASGEVAPLESAARAILAAWGSGRRTVRWPLSVRAGRKAR